jgi:hypothetical protein
MRMVSERNPRHTHSVVMVWKSVTDHDLERHSVIWQCKWSEYTGARRRSLGCGRSLETCHAGPPGTVEFQTWVKGGSRNAASSSPNSGRKFPDFWGLPTASITEMERIPASFQPAALRSRSAMRVRPCVLGMRPALPEGLYETDTFI